MPTTNPYPLNPNPSAAALPYNPALALWLSVDPLSDKYPGVSPYVYCGNNPVVFKDPNGKEKIIALNPSKNANAFKQIRRYTRNRGVIHFWGHGCKSSIRVYDKEEMVDKSCSSTATFGEYLKKNSYIYGTNNKGEESKTSILVLHSCETGIKGGIAQDLSKDLNLLVIAPSDDVSMTSVGDNSPNEKVTNGGEWMIYYKGEFMESFSGGTKPLFDNPQETIKKYDQMYTERHPNPEKVEAITE